jgi:magnesium transporter
MALTVPPPYSPSSSNLLQFPLHSRSTLFSDLTTSSRFFYSPWATPLLSSHKTAISPILIKEPPKCAAKSTAEEDRLSEPEPVASDDGDDYVGEAREDAKVQQHQHQHQQSSVATVAPIGSQRVATSLSDSLSLGIREPVYEVFFFFYFPPFYLFIYFF